MFRTVILLAVLTGATAMAAEQPGPPARSRYLLLDSRVVERAENVRLAVGTVKKSDHNPLFGEDRPWEVRFDNLYGNVFYDAEEKLYKCWYSPFIVDTSSKGMSLEQRAAKKYTVVKNREMAICYATSKDGLTWDKSALNLVEYEGSKANNIVWRGPHGAGVFKDAHEPNPARRYKLICQGMRVSFSPDGLHWAEPVKCQGVDVAGDTHNNALWAPTLGKYVAFTRTWGDMGREAARIESEDFVHWTPAKVVLKGLDKDHQAYAMPTFFYGGVYLGLVAIHEQSSDRVWTELAWSPDTKAWHRIDPGTPLIPCSEEKLAYDYGCVYACACPVFLPDGIRLYYGGSDWLHTSWRNGSLCLAALRPDGFAGYVQESSDKPGVVITAAIPYHCEAIRISADVGEGGSVKVSLVDASRKAVAAATPVASTVTDAPLDWNETPKAKSIRLRFELTKAKLYSFSLGKALP